MASYFFDTSAIVKYYHLEIGTPAVSAIFKEPTRTIRLSSLGFLELQSALAMKIRTGSLTRAAAGVQRAPFVLDIAAGEIEIYDVNGNHLRMAEQLIGRYGFGQRLRTLDALQLAVAIDLFREGLADRFVVADQALVEIARLEGLETINPERP